MNRTVSHAPRARRHAASVVLLAVSVVVCSVFHCRFHTGACAAEEREPRARARSGMVVTACPYASSVGRAILEKGGNAVDAAVAAGFALAVTFPEAGNIGGGGFMLIRMGSGVTSCIDYRERAPMAAQRDMYLDENGEVIPDLSTLGHLAAGVPGSVAGLYHAHRVYGTMPWRDLIEPAVELADRGFEIAPRLAASLERLQRYRDRFTALREFMAPDGGTLKAGDRLVQSDLARTLARIAECGPDDFYRGETADLITREMRAGGGLITAEDLASYAVMEREPVRGSYRGYEIISAPPPSSGGIVLLQILNILEGYAFGELLHLSEQHVHYMVEAEKRAYADRARYLGDPDYVEIPVPLLLSKEYADHSRRSIVERATPAARLYGGGLADFSHEETTHYSIVDRSGNAVSTTTTLNGAYGSKVIVGGAGFLLNNEMDDFSVKPGVPNMYGLTGGEANAIEPGKRMLSSMSPTIVMCDSGVFIVLGTPGGSTIITTVAQIIVDIIDFDMDPESAVYSPRFHNQWLPDRISYEHGAFSPELIARLMNRGHTCVERAGVIGDVQLILIEDAVFYGVADPRGGGRAEGVETVSPVR